MATGTVLELGWTNPLTGAFGAHPTLGGPLNLNDGATFTLASPEGLELPLPAKTLVPQGNIRTQGERASRVSFRANREARARLVLGPMLSYGELIGAVRSLLAWVNAAPSVPVTLLYQAPNASSPVSLDVVGAGVDIPSEEDGWIALQIEPVTVVFWCRPGLRGARQTLQNLVWNPGFEQGSGPGVVVFSDSFANTAAYTVEAGGTPTVAGNVMTVAAGTRVGFGSAAWSAINAWQVRVQWESGAAISLYAHYDDANDWTAVVVTGMSLAVQQSVAGTVSAVGSATATLASGEWVWMVYTQLPSVVGSAPYVQATLYADSGGAIGAQMATVGPVALVSGAVGVSGMPALNVSGAACSFGGAYANVHTVKLFGPGGWTFYAGNGSGAAAGVWEQNAANTFAGGPVGSFGAARIDAAAGGTLDAYWQSYAGGVAAGSTAMPCAAGQTLGVSVWARSSGLQAVNATVALLLEEYDVNGNWLRQDSAQVVSGGTTNGGWVQLAGAVTVGASCAYAGPVCSVIDTAVAGESAGGSVWFDNALCWNATTTGMAAMPYCELRFPQSPAQMVVSGLLGDLPCPSSVAVGTYLASWAAGSSLQVYLGRRAQSSAGAVLVGNTIAALTVTVGLGGQFYGGYYVQAGSGGGWNPRAFSARPVDMVGVYHLLSRFQSQQTTGNIGNVQQRAVVSQQVDGWFGLSNQTDQRGVYYGPWVAPLVAGSAWGLCDAGQVALPPFAQGALTDPTQGYVVPRPQCQDLTSGGSQLLMNWQMLLPVDGSLVTALVNNPSNSSGAISGEYLWAYVDGLLVNRAGIGDGAAWMYSLEAEALASPGHGMGGAGTGSSGAINLNLGAEPYLMLDPTVGCGLSEGVNQLAVVVTDNGGDVLSVAVDVVYDPLYVEVA